MAEDRHPLVSVIVPARNEEQTLVTCVGSLLAQDYPPDRLEVIVVVGGPADGTLAHAERLAREDGRVRVVRNPDGRTPVALNLGIDAASGELIGRLDGHARADRSFISAAVEALERTGSDGVGGVAEHVGSGPTGRAIALAMTSRLGSGNAAFRVGGREGESDTIVFPLYRRDVFDRAGRYDELLARNQDDEMNHRIRLAGGRLWFTPAVRSSYDVRTSLDGLWRQYEQYGHFRVETIVKHRRPGAPRQLAPAVLVAGLNVAIALEAATRGRVPVGRALVGGYALAVAAGGMVEAARAGEAALGPRVGAALATMHLASGTGFWKRAAARAAAAVRGS